MPESVWVPFSTSTPVSDRGEQNVGRLGRALGTRALSFTTGGFHPRTRLVRYGVAVLAALVGAAIRQACSGARFHTSRSSRRLRLALPLEALSRSFDDNPRRSRGPLFCDPATVFAFHFKPCGWTWASSLHRCGHAHQLPDARCRNRASCGTTDGRAASPGPGRGRVRRLGLECSNGDCCVVA